MLFKYRLSRLRFDVLREVIQIVTRRISCEMSVKRKKEKEKEAGGREQAGYHSNVININSRVNLEFWARRDSVRSRV